MATWACGSCGGENPEGMSFCGHCGAPADAPWTCADCGGENVPATCFCGHCGAARSEVAQAPQEPERDVADALRSFVAEQVADVLIEAGDKLPEERRLITALFADVSGFTSLADRLDPEDLLEVIDPVISGLSSIVGRYEGYVEKFAGDALLALFGAPVTHEDDAERALHVALGRAACTRALGPPQGRLDGACGQGAGARRAQRHPRPPRLRCGRCRRADR